MDDHEIARAVRALDPDWTVRDATPTDLGQGGVFRLVIYADGGTREAYLKASPDWDDRGVAVEGRLLSLLRARTDVPVPRVLGLVDDHPDLPAPFVATAALPGRPVPRTEMDRLPPGAMRSVSRAVGRHLAAVHDLDAVDAYGLLAPASPPTYEGGVPRGDPAAEIRVVDPVTSWPAYVDAAIEDSVSTLADTRFADLAYDLRATLSARASGLATSPPAVLGRVDSSLDNVLLDPDARAVTGMVDWAFTLAVTPAYDLVHVERSLVGGPYAFVPSAPDRRDVVREGLLAGYGERGDPETLARYRERYDLYELLSVTRSLGYLDDWLTARTDEPVGPAAERAREAVAARL